VRGFHRSNVCLAAAAALTLVAASAHATTPSLNTGSLGSAANGTNADPVTFGAGAVAAGGDSSAFYNEADNTNTIVPFRSQLNPASTSPFTIEFWAKPTETDNDDAVVSNRVSASPRSGWVFFQRGEATGWNLRMYNGTGGDVGWDLTGGTATLNAWSHVVATWDGNAGQLFVNGVLADSTNDANATSPHIYNASTTANLVIGTNDAGTSGYLGSVDEVAFYGSALTPTQIQNHFNTASSPTAGAYHNLVRADGALLQLSNNVPEPSSMFLLGLGGVAALRRRRR
jgi:hypothetical protein